MHRQSIGKGDVGIVKASRGTQKLAHAGWHHVLALFPGDHLLIVWCGATLCANEAHTSGKRRLSAPARASNAAKLESKARQNSFSNSAS